MDRITVPRSGDSPLAFEGEHLADADSQADGGPAEARWFVLELFRTRAGRYVARIGFRSKLRGEPDQDFARPCATPAEVREFFRGFDPTSPNLWTGFPPSVALAERRNNLTRTALTAAYDRAVSEVLAGDEFAEVVE